MRHQLIPSNQDHKQFMGRHQQDPSGHSESSYTPTTSFELVKHHNGHYTSHRQTSVIQNQQPQWLLTKLVDHRGIWITHGYAQGIISNNMSIIVLRRLHAGLVHSTPQGDRRDSSETWDRSGGICPRWTWSRHHHTGAGCAEFWLKHTLHYQG